MNLPDRSVINIITDYDLQRARRTALVYAKNIGLDEQAEVRLTTLISELSRNMLKYARQGTCEISLCHTRQKPCIKCLFRDQGPGIDNLEEALKDGFSTSGTLGVGLPGAKRLSDVFHIRTGSYGTIIEAQVHNRDQSRYGKRHAPKATAKDPEKVGIAIRSLDMSRFSGDQAAVWTVSDSLLICIVDGLGHGEQAEIAANGAIEYIDDHQEENLSALMQGCDKALRGGRGAAIALARIDFPSGDMEYLSVGNTRGIIAGLQNYHLTGTNGIVGEGVEPSHIERHTLSRGDVLILWTDGLPETLGLITSKVRCAVNAKNLAVQLLNEFASGQDDAGVVVIRWDA